MDWRRSSKISVMLMKSDYSCRNSRERERQTKRERNQTRECSEELRSLQMIFVTVRTIAPQIDEKVYSIK